MDREHCKVDKCFHAMYSHSYAQERERKQGHDAYKEEMLFHFPNSC